MLTVGLVNVLLVHRSVKSKTAISAYSLRPKRNRTSICGERKSLFLNMNADQFNHCMLRKFNGIFFTGFQTALMDLLLNFKFKTVSYFRSVKCSRQHMSCGSTYFLVVLTQWFFHSSYAGWTEDDGELSEGIQAPAVFWSCEWHDTHFQRLNAGTTANILHLVFTQKFDKEPHFSLLKELFIQVCGKSEPRLWWLNR